MFTAKVKGRIAYLGTSLLVLATGATIAKPPSEFTVHEWGTFLAMNGSDGITLDGMYHEEHALPGFVHARSKDQLRVPAVSIKGETPVIYFYSDHERDLHVRVRFPQGIWTQWYPQAEYNGPSTAQAGSPPELKNGHITWQIRITPPSMGLSVALPKTSPGSLWNYAREVDADYVRPDARAVHAQGEVERFLFYRGLGEARLPLRMTTSGDNVLSYDTAEVVPLRHLFLIRIEHGRAAYRYVPELEPGVSLSDAIPVMTAALPQAEFSSKIADDLANRLMETGLYPKEARAMVITWKRSYFETDGIRVLFVLPQEWTDKFIPMDITPKPDRIVRVMVGRLEVLTPEREREAADAVRNLGSPDESVRDRAYAFLRDQGRYLEPILRRTLRTGSDVKVRLLCKRLLATDFVTELHAAVNTSKSNAQEDRENELDARAQLASLLREIGLSAQAAEEARRILPDVRRIPQAEIKSSQFRPYARIHARTMEALGDEAGAAQWYARFVKFGSQSATCGGCHSTQGPTGGLAWYRDWWVGKKYAYYTARTQSPDAAIARQLAAVKANPDDAAAKMMLAYLYEFKGETQRADTLWAAMPNSNSTQTASVPADGN